MGKKIIVFGAGAVGGFVGGHLARAGENVVLIDPWSEHVDAIRKNGLHFNTPQEEYIVQVQTMHLCEVQSLFKDPVDIAIIATKSYDTQWATVMIGQYLAPEGFVVSLQNSINEECIAGIVGWGKTVGCIVSGIGTDAFKAGHIMRTVPPGGASNIVFKVGEVHGRVTQRIEEMAELLNTVDSAKVTTNLWGQRWTKLIINSMNNAVSAVTGLSSRMIVEEEKPRRLSIRLGGETIRVGQALGYDLQPFRGLTIEGILAAADGDAAALEEVERQMIEWAKRRTEAGRPSTAQDMLKGRRTEIDFINGLVVEKGKATGLATPANEAITELTKRVERGELKASPDNISGILD